MYYCYVSVEFTEYLLVLFQRCTFSTDTPNASCGQTGRHVEAARLGRLCTQTGNNNNNNKSISVAPWRQVTLFKGTVTKQI